jgi:hypothetical protein
MRNPDGGQAGDRGNPRRHLAEHALAPSLRARLAAGVRGRWALAEQQATTRAEAEAQQSTARRARIGATAVIVAVAVSSIAYRLIVFRGLQQTAALFVTIATILAVMVVFMISPRSATGVAAKTVTLGLLAGRPTAQDNSVSQTRVLI